VEQFLFIPALLRTHPFVFFAVHATRRTFYYPFISKTSRLKTCFFILSDSWVSSFHSRTSTLLYSYNPESHLRTVMMPFERPQRHRFHAMQLIRCERNLDRQMTARALRRWFVIRTARHHYECWSWTSPSMHPKTARGTTDSTQNRVREQELVQCDCQRLAVW